MGFTYRKSVKMGPFRVTASKSGVSYSVGGKGARVTKRANGRVQTTLRAPGTGLSYTKTSGTSRKKASSRTPTTRSQVPSTSKSAHRPPATVAQRTAKAPRQSRPAKPIRPPKPVRLRGHRFSARPQITAPWLLPFTVSGANGMAVTVHQGGIHIQRKRPKGTLSPITNIAWQEPTGIDFLEPGRFFSFGHVHFVTKDDIRGLVTSGGDRSRFAGRNAHAVQFIPPSGRTEYGKLRDLLTGNLNVQGQVQSASAVAHGPGMAMPPSGHYYGHPDL
jgi:hypothetical protein